MITRERIVADPRRASARRYLMCPPGISPSPTPSTRGWNRISRTTTRGPYGSGERLREVFLDIGHNVGSSTRWPGCPTWCSPPTARLWSTGGCWRCSSGTPSGPTRHRRTPPGSASAAYEVVEAQAHQRGRGRHPAGIGDLLLAGTGFRNGARPSHAETQEVLRQPAITLQLVDPRFYHLDTALCALAARPRVAYLPEAFSPGSREVLRRRLSGRDPRGHRGRRGARAQRGQRRRERRAAGTGQASPPQLPPAGTGRWAWTCPSCARPAAARSAARWWYAAVSGGHDDRDHDRPAQARRRVRRAQLPPAAGRRRRSRGRLGDRRRGPPLPGHARRVLGAELRPPAPAADRGRATAARAPHADQPGVPARPVRAVLRRAGRPGQAWRSCCR